VQNNNTWGKRNQQQYADFKILRYPVYLPIVRELAEKGDVRGLETIGEMAFPAATETLLDLSEHKNQKIAAAAEQLLVARMWPYRSEKRLPRENYMANHAWSDDLKARAIKLAWKWLAKKDYDSQIRGGQMLGQLACKDDLPALIAVMDKLLTFHKNDDTEQRAYLRPLTVCNTLHEATAFLIKRGAAPPTAPKTPGEAVAFLAGLRTNKDFRPHEWQAALELLLKHDIPFIRAIAVESTPLPMADSTAEIIATRIQDESEYVQGVACIAAKNSKSARFREPLLDALKTTSNDWILRGSNDAALACGVARDRLLEILVDCLGRGQTDYRYVALGLMNDIAVKHEGGCGWDTNDLHKWGDFWSDMQKTWRKFIENNRQALRDGKKFKIGEPPLSREMFPPKFQFSRKGQPSWPDWTDAMKKTH